MSIFCVISQIMKNKKFKEEETNNKNNRGYQNVSRNGNIINTVNNASANYASPKSLNTFNIRIIFPTKCFLS